MHFRNPEHAPYTPGYVPPTQVFSGGERLTLAGLTVEITHAPSDADDSVTFWFPELGVCIQNLVWPTLFNIFPIRGESYRDPQVLLQGIDHIISLEPEHMLGAHGPPISGKAETVRRAAAYRELDPVPLGSDGAGMNRGLTSDEMAHAIVLPSAFDDDYLTTEFYGVAEHHVRQIAVGVRGWFDDDASRLFPLEPVERAGRLVAELGGVEAVRGKVASARASNDLRWALELASWLNTRSGAETVDRELLAGVLRDIASRTTAMNIRNWCLTRARDLDGSTDLSRLREHRLRASQLSAMPPRETLHLLRVLLDPARAGGIDLHMGFRFPDAPNAGLHIRNCVSVATQGEGAQSMVDISYGDLVKVLSGSATLSDLHASGAARITGDAEGVLRALAAFDVPGLAARG